MRPWAAVLVPLLLVLTSACASLGDVTPGQGRKLEITGHTYDEIWKAALRVMDEHFEILEQDKSRGAIKGERGGFRPFSGGWGSWAGLFITPSGAGVETYTVEVVHRTKLWTTFTAQPWEHRILRDLQRALGL